MSDWRAGLLRDVALPERTAAADNPIGWEGYTSYDAVRWARGHVAGHDVVACVWDFSTYGGSFGQRDASAFVDACRAAREAQRPLVSLVRSGGTRLQEGIVALVGIPRAALALDELAAAGVTHVSVADQPTTGGVWVSVVSQADLRVGVAGATVGFSGPRVAEAMTGEPVAAGSHTAESACSAGLLDAVVPGPEVERWLGRALAAAEPGPAEPSPVDPSRAPADEAQLPARGGWAQVQDSRAGARPGGAALLDRLLDGTVDVRGADDTVRAVVGRDGHGRRCVGVAVAAERGGRPTAAGYRLLERAARLADRWRCGLVTLVDTPGADPGTASEAAGLAPAIAGAMRAVLGCAGPTVSVVHGEGGSGGALAAAVTDTVLVTGHGYFAALGPEGAASALRSSAEAAADRMAVTPRDLHRLGFADALVGDDAADLRRRVAESLAGLDAADSPQRLADRRARWAAPLTERPR